MGPMERKFLVILRSSAVNDRFACLAEHNVSRLLPASKWWESSFYLIVIVFECIEVVGEGR